MTARQLTSQNATITTASVQIKTLTVSGKQVTQAVFRQLREERLITRDGYLNGTPWGYVNYHPDKCGEGYKRHRHVVWQQGEDLLRSRVDNDPDFVDFDGKHMAFEPAEAGLLLEYRIYQWLLDAPNPENLPSGLKHKYGSPAQGHSYISIETQRTYRMEGSLRVIGEPCELAADAAEARLSKPTSTPPWNTETHEQAREREMKWCREHDERAAKAASALHDGLARFGTPPTDIESAYRRVVAAEAARRQRHLDLLKSLADLPQLFIAV